MNWDDPQYVTENPDLASFSLANTLAILRHSILSTYIPVTIFTFYIERHIFGLNPVIFHLNNIILHIVVSYLVFSFAGRLGCPRRTALTAALLFALHPLHVESVAWVTARKDVLYAAFYLAGLCRYWDYLQSRRTRDYLACLMLGLLSVLSKPMGLSFPWILLLLDWLARRKWSMTVFWEKVPFVLVIDGVALITYAQNARIVLTAFPETLLVWFWTAAFYVEKFFAPFQMAPLYELPQPVAFGQPEYIKAGVIVGAAVMIMFLFRKDRWVLFANSFYIGSAFFLWRFDAADPNLVANRFMYLPSLGYCLLTAVIVEKVFGRAKGGAVVLLSFSGMIFLAVLSVLSFRQCMIWKNPLTLWNTAIRSAPQQFFAYNNRGMLLAETRPHQALMDFERAIALNPHQDQLYYNKANVLFGLERFPEALADYNKAIDMAPRNPDYWNNRGLLFSHGFKNYEEALKDFNRAVAINPGYAAALNNRGSVYYIMDDQRLALADFEAALKIDPDFVEARLNADILYQLLKDR